MAALATILCALGIIALGWGLYQKAKAARLNSAPFAKTGDVASHGASVAGPKGAISAEGSVVCPEPLLSPVTGTPCLYYELKIVGEWKDGDSSKSKDYVDRKEAAVFQLDDGTGGVSILAATGGDFDDLEKSFEETKKEGLLADLKNALGKGKPIPFGNYAFENPTNSKADKFTCTERVLKVHPRLFALGKFEGGAITSPSFRSLVLTRKSRDELFGSTMKAAKQFLLGGAAALSCGVILGVLSNLGGAEAREAKNNAATVSAARPAGEAKGSSATAAAQGDASVCKKARACCEALNGDSATAANCANYETVPGMACASSLEGFKRALSYKEPSKVALCE